MEYLALLFVSVVALVFMWLFNYAKTDAKEWEAISDRALKHNNEDDEKHQKEIAYYKEKSNKFVRLNASNIADILTLKAEISALEAKLPKQCNRCKKYLKLSNPFEFEDTDGKMKPLCEKCFAKHTAFPKGFAKTEAEQDYIGTAEWAWEQMEKGEYVDWDKYNGIPYHILNGIVYCGYGDGCQSEEQTKDDWIDYWEHNDNWVIVSKPLDLSQVKPGTKVRLSNGVETKTVKTSYEGEICVESETEYEPNLKEDTYMRYFRFDGSAVNGSDIRIVEVLSED